MIELSYLASLQMSASSISKPTSEQMSLSNYSKPIPKQMPFLSSLKGTMERLLPSNNSKPTSTQVLPSSNSQGTMQQMPHCPRCHRNNHWCCSSSSWRRFSWCFLRRVAGVALVVVGLVLARDRAAGLVNHAPAAACLRGATADYAAATTDLRRRVAFRADADDAHDAGRIGRLAALLHRGADGYIGEQTKFCFFIPIDSSKTYICDYKH
ncbi:unnamed protein product [Rotaria sordida]|uniref:Uncharacterized protein n=1 Tax=Rotaria sordida TaxID=392033 RepID=A0A814VWI0_9BILA|nr:unnamed protein product [Rotaria sordida]CAF1196767.1 unnamed protein product [Rotaria sordida]